MKRILTLLSPLKVFMALLVLTTLINVSFAADGAVDNNPDQPKFSTQDLFPSWDEPSNQVQGIAGRNETNLKDPSQNQNKLFLQIVPRLIDLMIKFVAPAVFIMMVISGLRFIYSMDNEEERTKAKKFFVFSVLGLMFILVSYSLMQAVYFILLGN